MELLGNLNCFENDFPRSEKPYKWTPEKFQPPDDSAATSKKLYLLSKDLFFCRNSESAFLFPPNVFGQNKYSQITKFADIRIV